MARIRKMYSDDASANVLKRPADSPIAKAIKTEIRELLEAEKFTLGSLRAIERLAAHGRALLTGRAELDELLGDNLGVSGVAPLGYDSLGYDDFGPIGGTGVLAPSAPIENFGTKAIREMMSAIPKLNQRKTSIVEMIRALAEAKKHGLDNVAAQIEEELKNEVVSAKLERGLSTGAAGGADGPGDPGSNGARGGVAALLPQAVPQGTPQVDPEG